MSEKTRKIRSLMIYGDTFEGKPGVLIMKCMAFWGHGNPNATEMNCTSSIFVFQESCSLSPPSFTMFSGKCVKFPKRPASLSAADGGVYKQSNNNIRRNGTLAMPTQKPLRERIIHLLALKPYRKPELLLWLERERAGSKDKAELGAILEEVRRNTSSSINAVHTHTLDTTNTWVYTFTWPADLNKLCHAHEANACSHSSHSRDHLYLHTNSLCFVSAFDMCLLPFIGCLMDETLIELWCM